MVLRGRLVESQGRPLPDRSRWAGMSAGFIDIGLFGRPGGESSNMPADFGSFTVVCDQKQGVGNATGLRHLSSEATAARREWIGVIAVRQEHP